ncbi:MAG: DEAD/DEAH box helicase [Candidatus Omnitrophica bacterium]|nr:DEAD/DEAH box helicase [Candidatus Omnitrophota bacterium]
MMNNEIVNKAHTAQVPAQPAQTFYGLGIAPKLLDALEHIKFKTPTPIQLKTIPLALEGKDIIGIAQTGTGKTHSFAIPIIQRLMQVTGKALVLAPTRELAIQIEEAFQGIAYSLGIKTACLIGGASMHNQTQALMKYPRVVIATPGRLLDHMRQWNIILDDVCVLVLDEADRMLDMGFAPQIEQILRFVRKQRQTMLFSATIPKEIMQMAAKHMKLPVSVEIAPSGTTAEHITQELFIVKKESKLRLLGKLLSQYHGSVLLFSRTKHGARRIAQLIRDMGHKVAQIHSDRSLAQRRQALEGFKSGRYRILVATDIAARGIDVTGIEVVVNYDLPDDAQNYVHRIGRTARAGHKGHAISFATPDQKRDVNDIEKIIRTALPISKHPEVPAEQFSAFEAPKHSGQRFAHRPGRRNNSSGSARRQNYHHHDKKRF